MSLRQLAKDVQSFVKESYEYHVEFKEKEKYFLDNYNKGILGDQGLSQKLDEVRNGINEKKHAKANELKAKIEQVREQELKHIDETINTVTADDVAELSLISQLELTAEEMDGYVNKYKRTPLALKKLQEVATDKKMIGVDFPPDRKQYLNVVLGRLDNQISKFENMQYGEMTIKVQMYMDGAINGINEDVAVYRSL